MENTIIYLFVLGFALIAFGIFNQSPENREEDKRKEFLKKFDRIMEKLNGIEDDVKKFAWVYMGKEAPMQEDESDPEMSVKRSKKQSVEFL